jgi:glycosylphosphatidylinositol transamidase (GPIT) subunit GPI8
LISDLGARSDGIEGTGLSADPKSGFPAAFESRFQRPPSPYAANAYDSVLMLAYGLQRSDGEGGSALAKAISQVTSGRGQPLRWDAVAHSLAAIKAGGSPFIQGAVGPWMFDKNSGIELVASTYQHWTVRHGRFDVRQYISTDRSATAEAGVSAQKARPTLDRAHGRIGAGYTPGPRRGGWALLVAASGDWTNYRHQADVMAQYQRLRQGGVPADHIVVVAANNLARNPRNSHPPDVPYSVGGSSLNDGFKVDYPLHGMTADRLMEILTGRASARNPKVIRAGPGDDVYVYLAGHGNQNGLYLGLGEAVPDPGDRFSVLTPPLLDDTINSMAARHGYRRMLVVVEACEGGVLGQDLTAPGALLISAANSTENSLSANYDTDRHTWLADQFSYQLYQAVAQSPNASIDDIYQHLYLNVEGSHVSAYGPRFGDARSVQLKEFMAG